MKTWLLSENTSIYTNLFFVSTPNSEANHGPICNINKCDVVSSTQTLSRNLNVRFLLIQKRSKNDYFYSFCFSLTNKHKITEGELFLYDFKHLGHI